MINRRGMLKLLGLAPVAAPIIAAAAMDAPSGQMSINEMRDAVGFSRLESYALTPGDFFPFEYGQNPAVIMAKVTGMPVNEAMRAYCDEIVPVPGPQSTYTIVTAPYHPELTVHA